MFVTLRPSYYDASVEKKVFICNTKSLGNTYMVRGNYKLSRLVEIGNKTTHVGFYLFLSTCCTYLSLVVKSRPCCSLNCQQFLIFTYVRRAGAAYFDTIEEVSLLCCGV